MTQDVAIGLYDPESLRVGEDAVMTIDFISATDASDIRVIRIDSVARACALRQDLERQKNEASCPFLPLGRELSVVSGVFQFSAEAREEGLIGCFETVAGRRRLVSTPFRVGFPLPVDEVPGSGRCIAKGYMEDGALHVIHMAMMPPGAAPDRPPLASVPG